MNTLQIKRLLKNDWETKDVFKKVCALDQLEKPTFPSVYVINSDRAVNPENIELLFLSTSAVEENISTAMDYLLVLSVSSLTWISIPNRVRFTIVKPYKRIFQVFAVTIVFILSYFVVEAYLCMLLYLILRQTLLKTIILSLVLFTIYHNIDCTHSVY